MASTYGNLYNDGGFLESCQSNSYVFSDTAVKDIILYTDTPSQNICFGTQSDVTSALKVSSNIVHFNYNTFTSNVLGVGTSNFLQYDTIHRITVMGPSNDILGPNMAFFIDTDPRYPLTQHLNNAHDDIAIAFDAYWTGSNWQSSSSNGNFRIAKRDGKFCIMSSCNNAEGQVMDGLWRTAFMVDSNSFLSIGSSNATHRITVAAEDSSMLGPHLAFYTDADSSPLLQFKNWTHNDIAQAFDAYWDSSNWVSSDSNANFCLSKKDGKLMIFSACNTQPGTQLDPLWRAAFTINSNSFIGIGQSNPTHRLTIAAEESNDLGPHIAIYTDADSNYPLYQALHWSHDDMAQSYDAFYTLSNWVSCGSNANVKVAKKNGRYVIETACNLAPGSIIDQNWRTALSINSNSFVSIGSIHPSHRITLRAEESNWLGPHIAIYTDADSNNPLFQGLHWAHDDISHSFDAFFMSNEWVSSTSNANFRISKQDGKFLIVSSCNNAPGSNIPVSAWRAALMVNSNSYIGIGNSNPTHRVTLMAETSNVTGPHVAVYVDDDSNFPLFQALNWNHDDIHQSFDAFYTSNGWISSASNANFTIAKKDGRLVIQSACNIDQGSNIDSNWRVALAINSNSFLGIGSSNPTYRVTLCAEDASVLGPHMTVYTDADSNYPLYQALNWRHDDITQGFDVFYMSNEWISSASNANFKIVKNDGRLCIESACNIARGSNVDSNWRVALSVNSNSFLGVGNSNPTHRVSIMAEDASSFGPHMAVYTDVDSNYPLYQALNWSHDDITQSFDAFYQSNTWLSSHSNANFQLMKKDGRLLFITACNIAAGSPVDSNWHVAWTVNSNSFIGIGTSNPTQMMTMLGKTSDETGPHFAVYTDQDQFPLYHSLNWQHNDIAQGFDSYFMSNNWRSSDSNANFRILKNNGKLMVTSACNITPGAVVDNDWRVAFTVDSNSFVAIGDSNSQRRLTVVGEDASPLGPHVAFYTDSDRSNPLMEIRNWSNDDICISFDSYWDSNEWKSSSANGNMQIYKKNGQLVFYVACNNSPSSNIDESSWYPAFTISSNSQIGIGTSPTYRLTVAGPCNSVLGPHTAFFTDDDSNFPLFHQRNMSHDDIALSFDAFWDGSNWISSTSNANFQIAKQGQKLKVQACPFQFAGSNMDTLWMNAITVNSNGYVGIQTEDPQYALDVQGETLFGSNVNFQGDLIPTSNMTYDLGKSNMRWRDLYLSGHSINMENLVLQKETFSGGLKVYNNDDATVTRLWVRELLVGDPTNLLNSNVFLVVASNTGLQLQNVTSNLPPQDFSQLNNMYVTSTKVGVGLSNPEKSVHVIGDMEINPYITRDISYGFNIIRADIDDFRGFPHNTKLTSWTSFASVGYPTYMDKGGYYNGDFVHCSRGSNFFTLSNPTTFSFSTNAGLTILAMARFNRDAGSNESIFEFDNNGVSMMLGRYGTTNQLQFVTNDITPTPLISPSNTLNQNEWALYTIRYDWLSGRLEMMKNIDTSLLDLILYHNPIAFMDNVADISDKSFDALTGTTVGNANVDISHLYIFDKYMPSVELVDIQRSILYNANASLKIATSIQPYPPFEFYTDTTGWVTDGTRNGGVVYKKSYNHTLYGNGDYRVWASTENPTQNASSLLDFDSYTQWQTTSNTYTSTTDASPPPSLYLELPTKITVSMYTLTAPSDFSEQSPSKWQLQGSENGIDWFLLDVRSNQTAWTSEEMREFTVNCVTPCKFVNMQILRNSSFSPDFISLNSIQVYGNEVSLQLDGRGLGLGTSYVKDKGVTVDGSVHVSQCNIVGKNVTGEPRSTIATIPPLALWNTSNIITTSSIGNGTYIVTASSSNATFYPFQAFDKNTSSNWESASNMYDSSGSYIGAVTTSIEGTSRPGEWLQIQAPYAFSLDSYRITPNSNDSQLTAPSTWFLAGSSNGTLWQLLDMQSISWASLSGPKAFALSSASNMGWYNYYRLVANKIGSGGNTNTTLTIAEMELFGRSFSEPVANVGVSVTYGDAIVSDHLQVSTQAIQDATNKVFALRAEDLLPNFTAGTKISEWKPFSQASVDLQPTFYVKGGHKGIPYARFENQQTLSCGPCSITCAGNDGFSVVALVRFFGFSSSNETVFSVDNLLRLARNSNTSQLAFTVYNSNSSSSNVLVTGSSTLVQNQWSVLAGRYTNNSKTLDIFKDNSNIASLAGSVSLTDMTFSNAIIAGESTKLDVGALYMWDKPLSSFEIGQVCDVLIQGNPSVYVEGSGRISGALEGGMVIKSANRYTNTVLVYPPDSLTSDVIDLRNQLYGAGVYSTCASATYNSNYTSYGPFSQSALGWYGESNAYDTTTGAYTLLAATFIGSSSYHGDWLQIEIPEPVIVQSYHITPQTNYATSAPVSWYFMGSVDGILWNIIDTQTNYAFASSSSVAFSTSGNTNPYTFYRLAITECVSGGSGTVGVLRWSLSAKSKTTISAIDDKVIIFDRMGIQTSNPTCALDIAGDINVRSNLVVGNLNVSGSTVMGDFTVVGSTTLCNTTNILAPLNLYNNAIFNSNVTVGSNLLVQGGASLSNTINVYGQLNAFSNATFNSNVAIASNLLVQQGATLSNTVNIYGQLNAFSNATFNSNVAIASNLLVQGGTTLSNTVNIYGQLNAFSNATFNSNVTIGSNLLVQQRATLSNTVNIYGQLNAFSNATFNSNVTIGSNLLVQEGATLSNTVNIYGQLNAFSNATFNSNVTIGSNLLVQEGATLSNTINVYGQLNAFSNATFNSNVAIASNLLVQQGATLSNTINVYGQLNAFSNATFNSNVAIASDLLVQGGASLSNTINVYGQLNAFSNATFNSNVTVGGVLTVTDTEIINSNLTVLNNFSTCNLATFSNNVFTYGKLTTSNYAVFYSNVGIGTATPAYTLDVNGDVNFTGILRKNGVAYIGSQWSNNSSNVFVLGSNIGIKTSNPSYPLDVNGDINFDGILRQNGVPYIGSQWSNNSSNVFLLTSNVGIGTSNPAYKLDVVGDINFTGTFRQNGTPYVGSQWSNVASNVFLMGSNVAIGKSNANYAVDVDGDLGLSGNLYLTNKSLTLAGLYLTQDVMGTQQSVTNTVISIPGFTNTALSNIDIFSASNSTSNYVRIMTLSNEIARFTYSNVGIGNSNPLYRLDVIGDINFTGTLRSNGVPFAGAGGGGQWNSNNSNVFVGATSNVGIQTTTPAYPLDVAGSIRASNLILTSLNQTIKLLSPAVTAGENYFISMGCNNAPANCANVYFNYIGNNNSSNSLQFGFWNNSDVFRIFHTSNARVLNKFGVGFTGCNQPVYALDVVGDVNFTGALRSNGTAISLASATAWSVSACNVYVGANSNVGIGVTAPTYPLDVSGSLHTNNALYLDSSISSVQINFSNQIGGNAQIGLALGNSNFSSDANSNDLIVRNMYTNGRILLQNNWFASALCIASNNFVGIGTTVPTTKFDVRGTIAASNFVTPSTTAAAPATGVMGGTGDRLILYQGSVSAYPSAIGIGMGTLWNSVPASNQFQWYVNGGAVMSLSNNLLGVGTTSPSATFHVKHLTATKTSVGGKIAKFETSDASPLALWIENIADATATNQGFSIHAVEPGVSDIRNLCFQGAGGNVGIGVAFPTYTLHVNGTIYATGDITAFSDIRKKMNLAIIESALDKVDKISGYTFDMEPTEACEKRHITSRHAGVIAQEIEEVLPEIIYEDEQGFKSVAYGNLTALLIQAIKELRAEVNELKARLNN